MWICGGIMKLKWFMLFLMSGIFWTAFSQPQTGRISGRVFDNMSGKTISQEMVLLYHGEKQTMSARTNQSGNFSFISLEPGEYTLRIGRSGYQAFLRKVRVNPNFTSKIEVTLKPMQADEKKGTPADGEVSAPKTEVAASVSSTPPPVAGTRQDLPAQPEKTEKEPVQVAEPVLQTSQEVTTGLTTSELPVIPESIEEIQAETVASASEFETEYYDAVEDQPEPVGGWKALMKNVTYPQIAVRMNVQGTVYLQAWVSETGEVTSLSIQKSIPVLDLAAQDAVYKTKFTPGKIGGNPVPAKITIPVVFKLAK